MEVKIGHSAMHSQCYVQMYIDRCVIRASASSNQYAHCNKVKGAKALNCHVIVDLFTAWGSTLSLVSSLCGSSSFFLITYFRIIYYISINYS